MNLSREHPKGAATFTRWCAVLALPVFWFTQFQVRSVLVSWVCKTGRPWVRWTADGQSVLVAGALAFAAVQQFRRARASGSRGEADAARELFAGIGVGSAACSCLGCSCTWSHTGSLLRASARALRAARRGGESSRVASPTWGTADNALRRSGGQPDLTSKGACCQPARHTVCRCAGRV